MWNKVLGKVVDVCLASGLVSLSAMIVVKAVGAIKEELKGGKDNGRNPE